MKVVKTKRDFNIIKFTDSYKQKCSLQISSLSGDDYIWLGIDEPEIKILASKIIEGGTGWADFPLPKDAEIFSRMHLTRKQVKELLPHLIKFVETGDII
jgi:hypothetical protein